jgi:hypothetical protein
MDVWIVGRRLKEPRPGRQAEEFLGIFDSREAAITRCNGWPNPEERHWGDYIIRMTLNESLPDEPCEIKEGYWVVQGELFHLDGTRVEEA